ncbi:MAG: GIY-YIG catalytic domain protein [Candidatus Nomurabacteria bacterium GW2011_GWF2_43_8]|uniref:GIY-YIG catalytic domain protein n=1 Tax=Candidatus Nomurabacteria bacterium GW2011_GWF2_43_8 TaxID=1618779 RepID=A0A0G1HUJ2_9BACT|nr:MAG: GIY-YIG catalytic domain protein [Candidatus Nomurabacteria bacterium GW2011_GWF2_43_8]
MFFVYVLKSQSYKKSYVGHTDNLDRRLKEHNSERNNLTRRYMPWNIVYTEKYDNIDDAVKREKFLKTTTGRRFLKKIFVKIIGKEN